jgi:hypothetical protein
MIMKIKTNNTTSYTMKLIFSFMILSFTNIVTNAQIPKVTSGSIQRFENFTSKYVDARNVDVWLPDGYNATQKYAVYARRTNAF